MWLLCAVLLALAACSGEEARPPARDPAPPPVAQPAPPSDAAPPEPSPPAVTISALDADTGAGGGIAQLLSTDETPPHPAARVIRSHLADLKRCHTRPGAARRVRLILGFSVAPSGRLTALHIQSADRGFADCIAPAAATWTFDPPLDDSGKPTAATYEFPVHFSSK